MESKRTASRELALIAFNQLSKNPDKLNNIDITEIIELSADTLLREAESNLQSSVREITEIRDFIVNYEVEHPDNAESPIERLIVPVALPMTSDMIGRIDTMLNAASKIGSAIDMTEISTLSNREEVKDYAVKIISTFIENNTVIDEQIKKHSKGWDIDRLLKIDRSILRIAITELLFFDDIPAAVAINEAVELAKKYGTEESFSFINGILRQVFEENKLIK